MPANVLLIRWNGGWLERTDATAIAAHGRAEAYLAIGAVQAAAEADRVGDAQLLVFANPRIQVDAAIEPVDENDTPYLAYRPGDVITVPDIDGTPVDERVLAVSADVDNETGRATYVITLKDTILEIEERFTQAVQKMNAGTIGGGTIASSNALPPGA